MTVSVEWADGAKRALRFRYMDGWTWDEYYNALNQSESMMAQVPHPVSVIDDFGASGGFPESSTNQLAQYANALNTHGIKHFVLNGGDLWNALWVLLVRYYPSLEQTVIPVKSVTGVLNNL